MDKILEALKKLLPAERCQGGRRCRRRRCSRRPRPNSKPNFNTTKLEEAYAELSQESPSREDRRGGLRRGLRHHHRPAEPPGDAAEEYEAALEEGYEEAYQMLVAERKKNENLEAETVRGVRQEAPEMKDLHRREGRPVPPVQGRRNLRAGPPGHPRRPPHGRAQGRPRQDRGHRRQLPQRRGPPVATSSKLEEAYQPSTTSRARSS
jgi:hypothetical protein